MPSDTPEGIHHECMGSGEGLGTSNDGIAAGIRGIHNSTMGLVFCGNGTVTSIDGITTVGNLTHNNGKIHLSLWFIEE